MALVLAHFRLRSSCALQMIWSFTTRYLPTQHHAHARHWSVIPKGRNLTRPRTMQDKLDDTANLTPWTLLPERTCRCVAFLWHPLSSHNHISSKYLALWFILKPLTQVALGHTGSVAQNMEHRVPCLATSSCLEVQTYAFWNLHRHCACIWVLYSTHFRYPARLQMRALIIHSAFYLIAIACWYLL